MRMVFIGDSITESGRFEDIESIGNGYVRLLHDYFIAAYLGSDFEMINKGISGDRIDDLAARWQEDIIDLDPYIISISIGINDCWRQLKDPAMRQIYPEEFERIYDDLLHQVKDKTKAKIVLMEPTVIVENPEMIGNKKLQPYVGIVNRLAVKYEAILVPTHLAFLEHMKRGGGYALTVDGVHMNSAVNMLITNFWYEAVKGSLFFVSKK